MHKLATTALILIASIATAQFAIGDQNCGDTSDHNYEWSQPGQGNSAANARKAARKEVVKDMVKRAAVRCNHCDPVEQSDRCKVVPQVDATKWTYGPVTTNGTTYFVVATYDGDYSIYCSDRNCPDE